jgi:hypothetical protein
MELMPLVSTDKVVRFTPNLYPDLWPLITAEKAIITITNTYRGYGTFIKDPLSTYRIQGTKIKLIGDLTPSVPISRGLIFIHNFFISSCIYENEIPYSSKPPQAPVCRNFGMTGLWGTI